MDVNIHPRGIVERTAGPVWTRCARRAGRGRRSGCRRRTRRRVRAAWRLPRSADASWSSPSAAAHALRARRASRRAALRSARRCRAERPPGAVRSTASPPRSSGSSPMPSGVPLPARATSSSPSCEPQRRGMPGVGPAQALARAGRYVMHATVTNSLAECRPARPGRCSPSSAADAGSSENGAVAANVVRTNAARRAACKPVPDDVADDQHGRVLRPLGDEVEVAADLLGSGGQEGRGQLQAGALGQLGWRERVADRAQVLAARARPPPGARAAPRARSSRTSACTRRRAISASCRSSCSPMSRMSCSRASTSECSRRSSSPSWSASLPMTPGRSSSTSQHRMSIPRMPGCAA